MRSVTGKRSGCSWARSKASSRGVRVVRAQRDARSSISENGVSGCSAASCANTGRYVQGTDGYMSASWQSSPAGRSEAAHSRMRHRPHVATTSSRARCVLWWRSNARERSWSLWLARQGSTMRDSSSESIHTDPTGWPPFPFSMKWRSNVELWAITGVSPANSMNARTTVAASSASATMSLSIPVISTISAGMGLAGFTNRSIVSTTSRPRRRAAATSMSSHSLKSSPVVSVSMTTTSSSSRPKSRTLARCERVA